MRYERTDYIITTSIDGHLKFWKKQDTGIEFVKHYRAHLSTIVGVSASVDGQLFASVAEDGSAKVFDVVNFGMLISCYILAFNTERKLRYDQYDQARIYSSDLLLGPPQRPGSGYSSSVGVRFL